MAINVFKNITADLISVGTSLYTAPIGYSAIVLMAQISNITGNTASAGMFVEFEDNQTSLITNYPIPAYDSASALTGKLVLTSGQSIVGVANVNSSLQVVLSILESQN
jgi:hypothetical protein